MRSEKKHFSIAVMSVLIFTISLQAQISGDRTIPGPYGSTLTEVFNNYLQPAGSGIDNHLTLELANGYNEQESIRIRDYPGRDKYTLTIRPAAGASSCLISDDGSNSVFSFENAQNVVIDGRPGGVGSDQVLEIRQTQQTYQSAIRWGWSTSSYDTSYNVAVRYCKIRSDGIAGLDLSFAESATIENCDIASYTRNDHGEGQVVAGIYIYGYASNSIFRNNYIHDISSSRINNSLCGIMMYSQDTSQTNNKIYNNYIVMDTAEKDSMSRIYGIQYRHRSQIPSHIYFNTIFIGGTSAGAPDGESSYGIWIMRDGALHIKNNIIINKRRGDYSNYAINFNETNNNCEVDYNNYFVDTNNSGVLGYWNGNINSLALWQAMSGYDANSSNNDVAFINPELGDMHLSGQSLVDADLQGVPISGIDIDYEGDTRDPVIPFKGADEPRYDVVIISPNGSEIWGQGETKEITWGDQLSEDVKLELYKGGSLNRTISSSTASDGNFSWNIPSSQTAGSDYKIKITSTASGSLQDDSDEFFSIQDVTAPGVPTNLTANASNPSHWQNSNTFALNWTNPSDNSGISQVKYKVGSVPTSNSDNDGGFPGTPPQNFTVGAEGATTIYMWLVDNNGNEDYNNYAMVIMRYDVTIASLSGFTEQMGSSNNVWQNNILTPSFDWTAPADVSGIEKYMIYFGPDEVGQSQLIQPVSLRTQQMHPKVYHTSECSPGTVPGISVNGSPASGFYTITLRP